MTSRLRVFQQMASVTTLALVLTGCGSEEVRIALVPVTGTVTLNGKPMADATIRFIPDASNAYSTPGVDATGPEGNYKIRFKSRSGLSPGKYKVMVTPALTSPTAKVPDAFKDDPYMAQLSVGGSPDQAKDKSAGEQSEFEAEVTSSGGVFDFDVKKTAAAKAGS